MSGLAAELASLIGSRDQPPQDAPGGQTKSYTEALSHDISRILLFDPGDPNSLDLAPDGVSETLHAASYPRRLVEAFNRRNPFY